jgi:Ca2+-binding EF-hand superfamily protein
MPGGSYSLFDKIDGRIARKKLEKVLEMLRTESPQELRKRLGNIDRDEILAKMEEYNPARLRQMGISIDELKGSITERDLQKLIQVLGPDGAVIAQRIKQMLK